MFSQSCRYALQALLYIAAPPYWRPIPLQEIARRYKSPRHFLSKVLQTLVKNGILNSQKGPLGGFTLAKPTSEITLLEVVRATQGSHSLEGCLLGPPYSCESHLCSLHEIKEDIHNALRRQTIAQLID